MQLTQVRGPAGMLWVNDGGPDELPVLFLHAACGNANYWSAQLEHLRHKRRAVAFDLRGHGQSSPPSDNDYSFSAMSGDIDAVMAALHIQRSILVGHSIGAAAAIEYTARHRHRVAGLVLVNCTEGVQHYVDGREREIVSALGSDGWKDAVREKSRELLEGSRAEVRERVISDVGVTSREMLLGLAEARFIFDPLQSLDQYRGPKLEVVTSGNRSPFCLHRLLPDFPCQVVNDTGHWPYLDRPEEFNRILDAFILSAAPYCCPDM